MSGIGAIVHGLSDMLERVKKSDKDVKGAVAAAIYQEGLAIEAESVHLVPVDTGRLRASHYVAPPEDIENPTCEAGYGTDYAAYVHERTELNHPVGQSQFLKEPLDKAKQGYAERLRKRADDNLMRDITISSVPKTAPTVPSDAGGLAVKRLVVK